MVFCCVVTYFFYVIFEAPLPQGRLTPSPHPMRRLRIPNSSSKLVMTLNVSHQRLNSPKALIPVLPTVCTTLRTFDCLETQLEPYISKEPFKFSGMSLKRTISLYNKLSNITSLEALAAIHPRPQGQAASSNSAVGVFSPQTSIKIDSLVFSCVSNSNKKLINIRFVIFEPLSI